MGKLLRPGTALPKTLFEKAAKAGQFLRKPSAIFLISVLIIGSLIPLAINSEWGSQRQGALIGIEPDNAADPSGGSIGQPVQNNNTDGVNGLPPSGGSGDFSYMTPSSNFSVERSGDGFVVRAEEYSISLSQGDLSVQYEVRPYFTTDVIRYQRLDPMNPGEGTVDANGNPLDGIRTSITEWGQEGNKVWFKESCEQFALVHEFTIYRDYFELNVTYLPGTMNVMSTYVVGMYSEQGGMYNMFADGVPHRYIPGVPENTPSTHGIGGWFPAYTMFAPAFDMRVPGGNLGVEWGYDETEAYLYSPIWMKGMTVDGSSAFGLKYTSTGAVLPDPSLGEAKTFHMFVRPYQHTDNEPRGHDAGYAQWVAHKIASSWGFVSSPQFPLTFNDFGQYVNGQPGQWDAATREWVESSPILVATLSNNPDQVDWHYKSAQQMTPQTGPMPAEWQLWSAPGQQYFLSNGHPVASAASSDYRQHLIAGDPSNEWWWSSSGVFWDEMNSWFGENNLPRSDYNSQRSEFIYEGYLRLVQESRASGHWNFIITNPYTPQIHLAMLSDLTLVEGFEAVPTYNIDMKATVLSTMEFVNEMPAELRPHIVVYQNYDASSGADQDKVYSVLFNAARSGFGVELLSYAPYSQQMHNLQMAVDMFSAMGADRRVDPTVQPATIDMRTEGSSVTTASSMVVATGGGSLAVEFTGVHHAYSITNLASSAMGFEATIPAGSSVSGAGLTITSTTALPNGGVLVSGTIAGEATGTLVPA